MVVKIFKNFKEAATLRLGYIIDAIHGGTLLGIAGADFIIFYDWETQAVSFWTACMTCRLMRQL